MPDAPTPEMLKKMRLASEDTSLEPPPSSTAPSKRVATVQDADDDDDAAEPIGGETFAPGNDADYFTEEDEEGRFFGGGLTNEQKEILNIFDNAGAEQVPDDVRVTLYPTSALILIRSLMSISLKCSPLRVLKSCCYGWREPLIRIRRSGRNTLMIRLSGWIVSLSWFSL
jgi:hypothetical protein